MRLFCPRRFPEQAHDLALGQAQVQRLQASFHRSFYLLASAPAYRHSYKILQIFCHWPGVRHPSGVTSSIDPEIGQQHQKASSTPPLRTGRAGRRSALQAPTVRQPPHEIDGFCCPDSGKIIVAMRQGGHDRATTPKPARLPARISVKSGMTAPGVRILSVPTLVNSSS